MHPVLDFSRSTLKAADGGLPSWGYSGEKSELRQTAVFAVCFFADGVMPRGLPVSQQKSEDERSGEETKKVFRDGKKAFGDFSRTVREKFAKLYKQK